MGLVCRENGTERAEHVCTLTIGWYGCSIHARTPLAPGANVQLGHNGKAIDASVVYCLRDYSRDVVEVGLAFDRDGRDFWNIPVWKE
jgi:hypothetical protein